MEISRWEGAWVKYLDEFRDMQGSSEANLTICADSQTLPRYHQAVLSIVVAGLTTSSVARGSGFSWSHMHEGILTRGVHEQTYWMGGQAL